MVQSFVDRGWGAGKVQIPSNGRDKDAITTLAGNKVTDLRHEMSTAAFAALEDFFEKHSSTSSAPANPDNEEDWSDKSKVVVSPMHFREFLAEVSDDGKEVRIVTKQGMFEHPLILKVLGTYLSHVEAIPSGIQRLEGMPFGALEISIQAVERALTFYHTGQSTLDLTKAEHHFSYVNWGAQPVKNAAGEETGKLRHEEFHSTIRKLTDKKWKVILDGAREFITTKQTGKSTKKNQKAADPEEADGEDDGDDDDDNDVVMSDPPEPVQVINSIMQSVLPVTGSAGDIAGKEDNVSNLNEVSSHVNSKDDHEDGANDQNGNNDDEIDEKRGEESAGDRQDEVEIGGSDSERVDHLGGQEPEFCGEYSSWCENNPQDGYESGLDDFEVERADLENEQ
ncbi:hypothetical protein PQX77_015421 [Marasmius sp. AFHP31]|nr:hypothetical protein PQX77_015421 [Marasmius sp. AFHP31]